jgi:alpha-methylacyl-CoA racemase
MTLDIGSNLLDNGAHFYETYETADGKFMSVGAIEERFYKELLEGLDLDPSTLPHQYDMTAWPRSWRLMSSWNIITIGPGTSS